jgi:RNA polymerase sporulation-specific sigma factor
MFYMTKQKSSYLKPLTAEHEAEFLATIQQGGEESDIARKKLIEHNLYLVACVASKYDVPGCSKDELIQIGAIGLISAIDTYKMNYNVSLATFATRYVEYEIQKAFLTANMNKKNASFSNNWEDKGLHIQSTKEDVVADEVIKRVDVKIVQEILKSLPNLERIVLELRYGLINGHTHTEYEIAQLLCISRSYVSRTEKRAIQMIRESLSVRGDTKD